MKPKPLNTTRSAFDLAVSLLVATHTKGDIAARLNEIDKKERFITHVTLKRAILHCAWYHVAVSCDKFTNPPVISTVNHIARENNYTFLPEERSDE